ncbi:hypothetical protein BGZ83_000558 [Gryganskiella cystojenkinii]|nr:hypothetical protein BGZ83_000557 [Gryganskiella cystojenkinii]KAG0042360.1 hypothetical protein BGZ83_000558 [Gryganskiella cystojenkinii]
MRFGATSSAGPPTCVSILLAIRLSLLQFASAQIPIPVYGASQAVVQGKAMIISGGTTGQVAVTQTFSLDLTVPWDVSSPKYKMLAPGPSDDYVPSSLLGDDTLVVISNGQSLSFNLSSSQTWTLTSTLSSGIALRETRLTGAIDPATSTFYLPGGFHSGSAGVNDTMMAYNIALGTTSSLPMPSDLPLYAESTAAWSVYAKRLFLHGGHLSRFDTIPLGSLYSFNPADNTWVKPTVGGDTPPSRFNHCMASDATGKRLVVFGGFTSGVQPVLSDIYVLDVTTMQWKKGPDVGNNAGRAATSCGIDHDFFIVWGGGISGTGITNNITLLFNLQTMQWVDQFVPAAPLVTPGNGGTPGGGGSGTPGGGGGTPGGGSTPSKPSTSSNGAIIGGAVGGAAAIALAIGFFIGRQRRQRQARAESLNEKKKVELNPHTHGYGPSPPPVSRQQNEYYHEPRPYQSLPTTTDQSLSPQLWVGKDGKALKTSPDYRFTAMEPIRRPDPQWHRTGVIPLNMSDYPVNGPHAIIS